MGILIDSILSRKPNSNGLKEIFINLSVKSLPTVIQNNEEEHGHKTTTVYYVRLLHEILQERAFYIVVWCDNCYKEFEVPPNKYFCPVCRREI